MPTEYTLTFEMPQVLPSVGDYVVYDLPYRIIESQFIGKPDEKKYSARNILSVRASRSLINNYSWRFEDENLVKVLFEFGHRFLTEKIQAHSLSQKEELVLSTTDDGTIPCPFDPNRISKPDGAVVTVSVDTQVEQSSGNIAGGAYVGGNVEAGRDFIGRDKIEHHWHLPSAPTEEESN